MAKKTWCKPRYLNPAARKEYIKEQGCKCIICGFDFGETYGSQFDGEIYVHHVNLLHLHSPYDNADKIIKTDFAFDRIFNSLNELRIELADYVNWFNKKRIHGALDCLSPVDYRNAILSK